LFLSAAEMLGALDRVGEIPKLPWRASLPDFVMDALDSGRRLKCLTLVDDFTKESIDIVVDHSIPGLYVTRVLDQAAFRGCPRAIRTDQGPEFTGRALDQRAYRRGVELTLIAPGKPTQNAFIESFNGRFRDACLNDHWFEKPDSRAFSYRSMAAPLQRAPTA
jgi:putative transposase